jgi:hypothetical protein
LFDNTDVVQDFNKRLQHLKTDGGKDSVTMKPMQGLLGKRYSWDSRFDVDTEDNNALMANRKNSLKQNTTRLQNKNALIEEEEHGYVQILIKKDHLEELQSILTIHRNSTDISQNEITSLCGILADCGILNNKEN